MKYNNTHHSQITASLKLKGVYSLTNNYIPRLESEAARTIVLETGGGQESDEEEEEEGVSPGAEVVRTSGGDKKSAD